MNLSSFPQVVKIFIKPQTLESGQCKRNSLSSCFWLQKGKLEKVYQGCPKPNNKVPKCALFINCHDFDASLMVGRPRG